MNAAEQLAQLSQLGNLMDQLNNDTQATSSEEKYEPETYVNAWLIFKNGSAYNVGGRPADAPILKDGKMTSGKGHKWASAIIDDGIELNTLPYSHKGSPLPGKGIVFTSECGRTIVLQHYIKGASIDESELEV